MADADALQASKNVIEVWLRACDIRETKPPTWSDLGALAETFAVLLHSWKPKADREAAIWREWVEVKNAEIRRLDDLLTEARALLARIGG